MRVILTHGQESLPGLPERLKSAGVTTLHHPLITTVTPPDTDLRPHAQALLSCRWLLFASRSSVTAWASSGVGFGKCLIGAVGAGTAQALQAAGATVTLVPTNQTAAGLAAAFLAHPDAASPAGLVQGNRARPTLKQHLQTAGINVKTLVVYETHSLPWTLDDVNARDIVVLASPSAFEGLPAQVAKTVMLVAIGPVTSAAIKAAGYKVTQAAQPSSDGVFASIMRLREVTT